jgi:predicted nucleic acid-binding protein
MIVVDVNVVAYYFIEGEKTALARDLMAREPDWRLPPLWRHEYLNVLATYARQGGASLEEARTLWRRALELLGTREEATDAEAALGIASAHPVSAYDGQYVALAQRLQASFVTEDRRLLKAFPSIARTMQAFLASGGESAAARADS